MRLRRHNGNRLAALAAAAMLATSAACSGDVGASATPSVVTTSTIVADWARQVAGDRFEVYSLLPTGADPHTFQPGARDVARIADADLALSVGLGLEAGWLTDLLQNAARSPDSIVALGEAVDPIEYGAGDKVELGLLTALGHAIEEVEEGAITAEEGLAGLRAALDDAAHVGDGGDAGVGGAAEVAGAVGGIIASADAGAVTPAGAVEAIESLVHEGLSAHEGHGHGTLDPHFWLDPTRVQAAVSAIAERLAALDPVHAADYRANADAYNRQLDELDAWTQSRVSALPPDRRMLVTSHDSYGYFAQRYGFAVIGVILATATEAAPSASGLAGLVETVEAHGVPAVFGESTVSDRLAQAVAEESGAALVRLYSGSLGPPESGAGDYIAMMRTNVVRIVEGLESRD